MDSDEEIRLVNVMEDLRSQLKDAGHPIDPNSSEIFYRSLANKSTPADRIPKFRNQIQVLRQRLESHSGSAAVSPVVAHHDQRQKDRKRKADSPSEPEIQLHEAKVADGMKKKTITMSIKNTTMDRRRLCAHHMCILSECPWMNSKKKEINVSKSKTCWIHGIHPSDRNMEEKS